MDLSLQNELFSLIKKDLGGTGMDTVYVPGVGGIQLGDTLRAVLPMNDEGAPALLDLMVANLGEDTYILQYYTTLTFELGAGKAELLKALPALNFYCPIGSFGIYGDHQLYHKYSIILDNDISAQELHAISMDALAVLYDILDGHYPLLMALANGEQTYDGAVASGELTAL